MSSVALFLKKNKIKKPNEFFAVTKSLLDEKGEPLKWEIKKLTTKENDEAQTDSYIEVGGKVKKTKLDSAKYIRKAIAKSIVFPDLYNEELQNSYGVNTPEDLLVELVDDAGEWAKLVTFFNDFNGFVSLQEEIEEAKN